VPDVDIAGGRIRVDPPDGLLDLTAADAARPAETSSAPTSSAE
jgi:hypothetical protein